MFEDRLACKRPADLGGRSWKTVKRANQKANVKWRAEVGVPEEEEKEEEEEDQEEEDDESEDEEEVKGLKRA